MSEPYVGEIRMFGGNFAPVGWNFCDGSTLSIADNDVLFVLIGTTYGGDGVNTFNVPDLRGRAMVGTGSGPGLSSYLQGQFGGTETVTLTTAEIPAHGIPTADTSTSTRPIPEYGLGPGGSYNNPGVAPVAMAPVGGSQPHENMAPFQAVNFIISLFGIFPSQT
jgi:microcystin-dependent protein